MKTQQPILFSAPDDIVLSGRVVQCSDTHAFVAHHENSGHTSVPLAQCVPFEKAFEAFNLLPVIKSVLAQTEAERDALKAQMEQLTAQLDQANEGYINTSKLLEAANAKPAESAEPASVATPPSDPATAGDPSSVTP